MSTCPKQPRIDGDSIAISVAIMEKLEAVADTDSHDNLLITS
jgi:hypothetical protein